VHVLLVSRNAISEIKPTNNQTKVVAGESVVDVSVSFREIEDMMLHYPSPTLHSPSMITLQGDRGHDPVFQSPDLLLPR